MGTKSAIVLGQIIYLIGKEQSVDPVNDAWEAHCMLPK